MKSVCSLLIIILTTFISATVLANPFNLAPLTYSTDALEPAIDKETMELHYGKHHKAYVDNLNKALVGQPALQNKTLEQLLANVGNAPAAIRDNAGGHWNHTFFWKSMAPVKRAGPISPELKAALDKHFGSVDVFKTQFRDAGVSRFGSGWVWLVVTNDGQLVITSTANQDNPLMDIAEVRGIPILGNDLWEHAYYLQYNNRRADYLDAWWQVVDWTVVSQRYAEATKK